MYVRITHYVEKRIIIVTQLLIWVWWNWCRTASHLSRRRHYFKPMLARWDSIEIILSLNASPSVTLRFMVKAFSTPGVVRRIVTDNYHWIRRKVRNLKNCPWGHIKRKPYHKPVFVYFIDMRGNISLHTNRWSTGKILRALTLTSSLIFLLRSLRIWIIISRRTGVILALIASSSAF